MKFILRVCFFSKYQMKIFQTIQKLTPKERSTFKIHLTYVILQGIIQGAFVLNEFIFITDMNGSKMKLSILLQFAVIVLLFSTFINEFLKRLKFPMKAIRKLAFVTHLPLILLFLFPKDISEYHEIHHTIFLAIFLLYYLNDMIVMPSLNQRLKINYSHENFGKLYSYSSSLNKIMILLVAFGFGIFLDYDNFAFTYIYPVLAILGIASVHLLSRIQKDENPLQKQKIGFFTAVNHSFKTNFQILKNDRPFLHFQFGFMLYGFAWMITAAVITIYFKEVFEMNHQTFSFYKNVFYNILAIILLPFFGKLLGKIDPRRFGIYTFGSMMLFIFTLAIAQHFMWYFYIFNIKIFPILIIAYLFYSVFAATMALLWYIGSAYFCKDDDVADYQSVHLFLTGFRGIIGFQLGIIIYEKFGFSNTFFAGTVLLILAMLVLLRSEFKHQLKPLSVKKSI